MNSENITHQDTATQTNLDPAILKVQLDNALGENKTQYWDHIRSFIKGKINRMELDFWANLFLSNEHSHLHEEFVRASINKNKKKTCVDVSDRRKVVNNTRRLSIKEKSKRASQHKVLKDIFKSMEKDDRNQLRYFLKNAKCQQERKLGKSKDSATARSDDPKKEESMCSKREFPEYEHVYARMKEIALNNELVDVQEDCVSLMLLALEAHTKNILHSCINKIRKVKDLQDNDSSDPVRPPISLKDLAFSIELSPHVATLSSSLEEKIRVNLRHDSHQIR
ncbi:1364_t:CDS:2 [Acaulospora colombiana]|uniref:1364_t:CDS:1 n=1 Tax=Acaulospora colombiana TaxID=27376 RepID=A0ACA9MA01_9GLOM|nr:1364_t:CDS:2 [Acaulospora colombiana]